MFRALKSFVFLVINKILGIKIMANYLLECEIIGGEISGSGTGKIRVYPRYIYQKSSLAEVNIPYGIVIDDVSKKPDEIDLSDPEQQYVTLEIDATVSSCIYCIRKEPIVLTLDSSKKKVIGFKVQF